MEEKGPSLAPALGAAEGQAAAAGMSLFVVAEQIAEGMLMNLLERSVAGETARLEGFEKLALAGVSGSVISPADGVHVDGRLYRRLSTEDYRRLDAYCGVGEGLYRRLPVTVKVGGTGVTALVYLPTEKTLRRYR